MGKMPSIYPEEKWPRLCGHLVLINRFWQGSQILVVLNLHALYNDILDL